MESADGWIEHDGKGAPDLPAGTLVQVRTRDGWEESYRSPVEYWHAGASWWVWPERHHCRSSPNDDIIAYRVVTP